jgi:hypothetical protein
MSNSLRLFNPNEETVKLFEPKRVGGRKIFPQVIIEAGYKEKKGTCCIGQANQYSISFGVDRVLEVKIGDISRQWINGYVNQTYKNMPASSILVLMLTSVGVGFQGIELGKPKLYRSITIRKFSDGLKQICRDTDSEFSFKNGVIRIYPKTPRLKRATLLTNKTGLLQRPEKTDRGFKLKTLFFYDIEIGDYVRVESEKVNTNFKVVEYKKNFSTFGEANCEFDVVAI